MIIGIGTDLVEIERIKKALTSSFLKKYYSKAERQMLKQYAKHGESMEELLKKHCVVEKAAGNFAVKEAVVKSFGTGFTGNITPDEISVLRDSNGKPYVLLEGEAKNVANRLGVEKIHVSITNIATVAQAFVVCES